MKKKKNNKYSIASGSLSPFWISFVVSSVCVLGSIFMWQEFRSREKVFINSVIEERASYVRLGLLENINSSITALRRMARRWEVRSGTPKDEWMLDAKNYVEDNIGLTTIEWVDETYHVKWIEPLEGNEEAQNLNIAFNQERKDALKGAAEENAITLTPPLDLVQGYRAFISYIPIHKEGVFDGFIVGIFDANDFFESVMGEKINQYFWVTVTDEQKVIFSNDEQNTNDDRWKITEHIKLYDREWKILFWPKEKFIKQYKTMLPELALLGGVAFSLLLGIALYYSMVSSRNSMLLRLKTEDLKRSEGRLNAILETAPGGILSVNGDGVIKSVNKVIENIFGYSEKELIGKKIETLVPKDLHKQHVKDVHSYAIDGAKRKMAMGREVVGVHKNKRSIPLEIGLSRTVMPDGSIQVIASVSDITERKNLEIEREQFIEKLAESNEELGRFAYVASHDLQEPLRMVVNFTQLLKKKYSDKLDEQASEYIEISATSAERMQNLVRDLLDYARINEGAEVSEEIDCKSIVNVVIENLADRIKETKAEIICEELPVISGNPIRFSRVMQNLIGNGIKYQKEGRQPKINISVTEEDKQWKFCIRDNGIGMKKEYCEKIFLPFQRLHSSSEYTGTGIGLAICAKIIEKMNGKIWAESEVDKGTRFYFTVPKGVS